MAQWTYRNRYIDSGYFSQISKTVLLCSVTPGVDILPCFPKSPDHSVDKTDPPRLSLSPEDSSHDNHVGTGKDRKDQDLDNEWLPDLDSSSDESDLEACESVKILLATTVEQSAASARSSADDTRCTSTIVCKQ